jgi:hypothetical protein
MLGRDFRSLPDSLDGMVTEWIVGLSDDSATVTG